MPRSKSPDGRVNTAIRMDPELWARLRAVADERHVSVNLLATRAITEYLDRLVPLDEILRSRP